MSSAASISFERLPRDTGTIGVTGDEWHAFCREHQIEHSPNTIGGNVYYAGEVEVHYAVHMLRFSTYWGGKAMSNAARLALLAWRRWGGSLEADPEIRKLVWGECKAAAS